MIKEAQLDKKYIHMQTDKEENLSLKIQNVNINIKMHLVRKTRK